MSIGRLHRGARAYAGHIDALQGRTRLQLREGRGDETTDDALREIALRGEDERWRKWARRQLK